MARETTGSPGRARQRSRVLRRVRPVVAPRYTTLDGRQVTLRAVAFTDRDEQGLVTSVRLYTDTAPLFEGVG